jgi:hypothetical protein
VTITPRHKIEQAVALVKSWRWFYTTRLLGVVLIMYALVLDKTDDRGTILVGGFGLLGLDRVARTDSPEPQQRPRP